MDKEALIKDVELYPAAYQQERAACFGGGNCQCSYRAEHKILGRFLGLNIAFFFM
ncbi:hypothetical protein [Candidatus Fukatsuia endosymbiont of Tuberolachnus salignus]|uniref:hypothetical protein n=1 Tax=Candidatus Fukatsuia endosymbiont of Tuberolachnus salignus TaxID=3077957 RepID=UPI003CC7A54E